MTLALPELALALAALLLTPGPTNTLMAIAGAERGTLRAAALIPAEIAAYLAVTVPLALAGGTLTGGLPWLHDVLAAAAAVWVAVLAAALWRAPSVRCDAGQACVTGWRIFATTLMNPKALVIGLVLLPGAPLGPRAALFVALTAAAALAWILAGSVARGGIGVGRLRRIAAASLWVVAAGLARSVAGGGA